MTNQRYQSWGRFPAAVPQGVITPTSTEFDWPTCTGSVLAVGKCRSYGDVCLNDGNFLLDLRWLDRFVSFDRENGTITCEAGASLSDIADLVVPNGWFLPVTPGTSHITLGGAIANDVHGKDHHESGCFGNHVNWIELLRSDGSRSICSPSENTSLFNATIGGLGLTGVILKAEFRLSPMPTPYLDVTTSRFANLEEFYELSSQRDSEYPYTVAWIDCIANDRNRGRGVFFAARKATDGRGAKGPSRLKLSIPFELPFSLVTKHTIRAFNASYYAIQTSAERVTKQHYRSFFYMLDGISDWNRLYGRRGLLQYQSVVPVDSGLDATSEMLAEVAAAGSGSFLAVLKRFGEIEPLGLLSFPRPGYTIAMDFPYRGKETLDLMSRLDSIVSAAGGAIYPAKDARMSGDMFESGFPNLHEFSQYVDPKMSSGFWRRISQ